MRKSVGQDRAAACGQLDLGGARDFGTGKEHQRIGGQRQEGMFADLKARRLFDRETMRPMHNSGRLRGHVRGAVRVCSDRERDTVATVKTAGGRLQIERGKVRTRLVEIEGARRVKGVGDALAREHCAPAAVAEMQRRLDRAREAAQRSISLPARVTVSSTARNLRISGTKRLGSWRPPPRRRRRRCGHWSPKSGGPRAPRALPRAWRRDRRRRTAQDRSC